MQRNSRVHVHPFTHHHTRLSSFYTHNQTGEEEVGTRATAEDAAVASMSISPELVGPADVVDDDDDDDGDDDDDDDGEWGARAGGAASDDDSDDGRDATQDEDGALPTRLTGVFRVHRA